jgi:predicted nuclease of predicted toxin-antitoxin system
MKFLADESFPACAVTMLEQRGHDVVWVARENPGSSDMEILKFAINQNRIVLTLDKDFSDLVYRNKLPMTFGIILFRGRIASLKHFANFTVDVIEDRNDWIGNFSIVEWTRIRIRPLKG